MEYRNHKKNFIMLEEQNNTFAMERQKPIRGYLKVEIGEGKCAVRAGVENLRYFERSSYVYKLILFGKKNEKTIYKIVGNLLVSSRGRGETYLTLDPSNVDDKGNDLECFTIAIIVAVSTNDTKEPLHPILRGNLDLTEKVACKMETTSYNSYYNEYILQCCKNLENKKDLYDRMVPFSEDRTKAEWKRIVNLGKFPVISPGSQYTLSRYRHFIFGISDDYYFVGVPGRFMEKEQPEEGRSGFVLWQAIIGAEAFHAQEEGASLKDRQVAYGYWIAAINKNTGRIEDVCK